MVTIMVTIMVIITTTGMRIFVERWDEESGACGAEVGLRLDAVVSAVEKDEGMMGGAVMVVVGSENLRDIFEVDDLVDEASGGLDGDGIVVGAEPVFDGKATGEGATSRLQSLGVWLSFCVMLKRPLQ